MIQKIIEIINEMFSEGKGKEEVGNGQHEIAVESKVVKWYFTLFLTEIFITYTINFFVF